MSSAEPPAVISDDAPLIPISALQHHLYCPRQCALIHLERVWSEDVATAEGRLMHERVDRAVAERRRGVRTLTALPLRSVRLRLIGKADTVEMREGEDGEPLPFPIESKRGRPKSHRADEVQLCAQGLCLEEMLDVAVPRGAIFYGTTRRRYEVELDDQLRFLTRRTIVEVVAMLTKGVTPAPIYERAKCRACSLSEICRPELSERPSAAEWLDEEIAS